MIIIKPKLKIIKKHLSLNHQHFGFAKMKKAPYLEAFHSVTDF